MLEFLNRLDEIGVRIAGRERVFGLVGKKDWKKQLTLLVVNGRTEGVTFSRIGQFTPSDVALSMLMTEFRFSEWEKQQWCSNIF